MPRFEQEPSALPRATAEGDGEDSLFERWLARSKSSRARMRAVPARPPAAVAATAEPLGDELADAWFK
jgi:hypothetical protein